MIEVQIVETLDDQEQHAEKIQKMRLDGWLTVSHHVVHRPGDGLAETWLYSTMIERDSSSAQQRVDVSSLQESIEVLMRRQRDINRRLKVVESTLDDDTSENERAYNVVPGLSRVDIIADALVEDQERGL